MTYVRTGAWYAHTEGMLLSLSLLATKDRQGRMLAVNEIRKLRGASEFGDVSVRPRITTKPNLSANSLTSLFSWHPEQVYEPDFTCHMADV